MLQYCKRCGKKLNSKMKVYSLLCRPCTNWTIAQKRRKDPPKCIDCGAIVSKRNIKRCRKCNSIYMIINPPNKITFSKRGQNAINWRGGKSLDKRGYIYVKSYEHPFANARGYVFEHRLVMEKHLGRYLRPEEVVHHIDGDHSNNIIDNLKLFPNHSTHNAECHKPWLGRRCIRDAITGRYVG